MWLFGCLKWQQKWTKIAMRGRWQGQVIDSVTISVVAGIAGEALTHPTSPNPISRQTILKSANQHQPTAECVV